MNTKLLISFFILTTLTYAQTTQKMLSYYKQGEYKTACTEGQKYFNKNKKDEKYVQLYAFSCLKVDHIDRLAMPIITLRNSKEGRKNAAYFSIILMQKKLLYHAIVDGYKLDDYRLPTTDNILSTVFDLYVKHKKEGSNSSGYTFSDSNSSEIEYKLYKKNSGNTDRVIIELFKKNKMIEHHEYW